MRILATALVLLPALVCARASAEEVEPPGFALCTQAKRVTCIVDGDTFWLDGTKIRIADINTPETARPGCERERRLGERATRRLAELLNAAPFTLAREGRDEDRYGRKLRIVMSGGTSVGARLVEEGLAERWTGRRGDWCGADGAA